MSDGNTGHRMHPDAYLEMAATEDRHWWFRGRRQILNQLIAQLQLAHGSRILELGAGTGGNLAMLARYGTVTAVERDATARAMSLRKTAMVTDIRAGSMPDQLPLDGERFDLVCMFDVLEHVEADQETLDHSRRFLAPGGTLIVTVPAYRRLWGPHDIVLHHKRRYEKAELRAKLTLAGFTISRLSYANMFLLPVAILMRLKERVLGQHEASGTGLPPHRVNEIFARLFGAERHLLTRMTLPFGLSLVAIAKAAEIAAPAFGATLHDAAR